MKLRAPPSWASLLAIFAASLAVIHHWSGTSPALWLDTLNDQREVRQCVVDGSCSLLGQAASVDGLFVAGGWLTLRSLFFALGVGLEGVHLGIQALDALGVALTAIAGFRLGGRWLGAGAALTLMAALGRSAATREAVYNTSPLLFFGAVLLLACLSVAERRSVWPATVTALLAAVMTDTHATCTPAGITVVLVALLAPGRRILRATAAAFIFAAAAFALAPVAWMENARFALERARGGGGAAHLASLAPAIAVVRADPIALAATIGLGTWLVAAVARRTTLRRSLDVVAATAAPMMAVFLVAVIGGLGDSGGKYLAHLKPAAALGVAVPAAAMARWLFARAPLPLRVEPLARRLLPWLAALAIAVGARTDTVHDRFHFPLLTVRDTAAFVRVLRDERGWSRARIVRRAQAIDAMTVLSGLLEGEMGAWPAGSASDDDGTSAFLLSLDVAEIPEPLPAGWTIARRTASTAAVVAFSRSRLDLGSLSMCDGEGPEEQCLDAARLDPEIPHPRSQGRMTLRVPLLPGPPARLFMPRNAELCGGRITSAPRPPDPDGRSATLEAAERAGTGLVVLTWDPHTAACPEHFGRPRPPFFIEGDVESVAALEAVLRRREP